MIDPKLLPENIRRCMPKGDRKQAGALTLVEVFDKEARREEVKLHQKFMDWCQLNEVSFVHSRTDRKSTIQPGHPDFTLLWHGRGCCIEFKAPGGKLSQDQEEAITVLAKRKVPCLVTSNLAAAISFAVTNLGISYCEYPTA